MTRLEESIWRWVRRLRITARMQNITTEHCHSLQSPQFQEEKVRCSFTLATSFAEKFFFTPRNSLCALQRAVLRTVSTMLSALAGGWGRSAPPAPKLDPGGSCPTAALGSSHGAPSRRSRAGPLPTACPTTCGAQAAEAQVEGGRRPESADTDELTKAHAHPGSPPPTPERTPLSPPKMQLRISGVFAPFGRQQCHSGVRHALLLTSVASQRNARPCGKAPYTTRSRRRRSEASTPGAEVYVSHCWGTTCPSGPTASRHTAIHARSTNLARFAK